MIICRLKQLYIRVRSPCKYRGRETFSVCDVCRVIFNNINCAYPTSFSLLSRKVEFSAEARARPRPMRRARWQAEAMPGAKIHSVVSKSNVGDVR